jgi:hypothetical protein
MNIYRNNPARPCFGLRDAKEEHFSDEMVKYIMRPCWALRIHS